MGIKITRNTGSTALTILLLTLSACSSASDPMPTTALTSDSTAPPTTSKAQASTTTLAPTTATQPEATVCAGQIPGEGHAGGQRKDGCGVEQVFVPAGSFTIGTENPDELSPPDWAVKELGSETPAHEVEITKGFWIDRFEVTNASFDVFVESGGYEDMAFWSADGQEWLAENIGSVPVECGGAPNEPRVCVTWHEATAYASWRGGRLPTEAEWEYTARGPESLIYPWGDAWDPDRANVVDSDHLTPVGSFPDGSSWVGAHDMSGNAMEWVSDFFSLIYYGQQERVDPTGPPTGRQKIEKGGWWGSNPYVARSAYRHFEDPPDYQDQHVGFRILTPTA